MDEELLLDLWVARETESVPVVRHQLVRALPGPCVWAAPLVQLVASELLSNAVRHADSSIQVRLRHSSNIVRLEVVDDGPGWPTLIKPAADVAAGRGLAIVAHVAYRWGADLVDDQRKVVWAEIACAAATAASSI